MRNPEGILEDTLVDLQVLLKELYGRLDSSIRYYLQRRGISIRENVYTGFDTEYTNSNSLNNKLVSAQLAVSCKTQITVPRLVEYQLSRLDEETNKLIPLKKDSSGFNYAKVENSIKLCIRAIRTEKYGRYDTTTMVLDESLRLVKGVVYYESEDSTLFSLPRTVIQPYITICDTFTFEELMEISGKLAKPLCNQRSIVLMKLFEFIASVEYNIEDGRDKMLEKIHKSLEGYDEISSMESEGDKVLDYLTPRDLGGYDTVNEKSTRRLTKNLPDKVCITVTRLYFVIGHLTPADLSQLSDFDEIKEELSIVNGSFVTLGKALKYRDRKVHVRDTMLLAPGGSKGLAVIGGLYPKYKKLEISTDDLENMQGLLDRDPGLFVSYALRDAVITLIHASWMEEFNFGIGGVGVPISLSSIGRRFVKSK
jgi:hypothetical protein